MLVGLEVIRWDGVDFGEVRILFCGVFILVDVFIWFLGREGCCLLVRGSGLLV